MQAMPGILDEPMVRPGPPIREPLRQLSRPLRKTSINRGARRISRDENAITNEERDVPETGAEVLGGRSIIEELTAKVH